MSDGPCGLAVLDKPPGMTSHDVVAVVRGTLRCRRVGHAGTLDPPATGLLLVGVGPATRLLRFLQGTDKTYEGTLVLGTTTTTLDAEGEVTSTADRDAVASVGDDDVAAAASALTGELDQVPPMVSAIKVGGRRLHELARRGETVERAARRVTVAAFEVGPLADGRCTYRVTCSTGTYVRSLVDDLGRALGVGAHVATLRRTGSGTFRVDDAQPLEAFRALGEAAASTLRPPLDMVAHLGVARLGVADAASFAHGRAVAVPPSHEGELAVCDEHGALLGVAVVAADGTARPEVVLAGSASRDDG